MRFRMRFRVRMCAGMALGMRIRLCWWKCWKFEIIRPITSCIVIVAKVHPHVDLDHQFVANSNMVNTRYLRCVERKRQRHVDARARRSRLCDIYASQRSQSDIDRRIPEYVGRVTNKRREDLCEIGPVRPQISDATRRIICIHQML